jgi:hypothetical protein
MFGVSLLPSPHTSVAAAAEIEEKTELEEAVEAPWQHLLLASIKACLQNIGRDCRRSLPWDAITRSSS